MSIWEYGAWVLKEPLLIIPIKCWTIFLAIKSKKRRSIGRRHVGAKKRWVWKWVSPKMGVWQKCSRTQGSKKILRETSEGRLRSLENFFFFFFGEEMVRWRKIKWRKKMNNVMMEEMWRSKKQKRRKERQDKWGAKIWTPHLSFSWVAKSTQSNWVDLVNSQNIYMFFFFFLFFF